MPQTIQQLIDAALGSKISGGYGSSRSTPDITLDIAEGYGLRRAQEGEDVYGKGLGTAAKSTDYWSTLLSGDKKAVAEATEPERYSIGKAFQAGRQAIAMGPRGGGTSSALAESRFEEAGQIGRLIQGQRAEAAKSLAETGMKQAELGLRDIQTAEQSLTSIFESLLSGQVAIRTGQKNVLGEIGKAVGSIIGKLLTGGSSSGGGVRDTGVSV
jgi:hypothetical protein